MTAPRGQRFASPAATRLCNVVLLGAALALAAFAAYALTLAETYRGGAREIGFFLGVPLGLCAGALLAMRLQTEQKLRLVLLSVVMVIGLFLTELALSALALFQEMVAVGEKIAAIEEVRRHTREYDERDIRHFLLDHWTTGDEIYPRIYQLSERVVQVDGVSKFPTSSLSNRRIIECFADGRYKVWDSDEYGFTNPRGVHARKAKVVLVGDSFTAGECVSVEEDIGAVVRATHPSSVNLGVGGAGPLWELANLVEYGLPLRPDYVFWLYYEGNDFADLRAEMEYPELTGYLEGRTQQLRSLKARVDERVADLQKREMEALWPQLPSNETPQVGWNKVRYEVSRAVTLTRIRRRLGLHRDQLRCVAEHEAFVDDLERVILEARARVEGQGGRFVFVYLPDWARFLGRSPSFDREQVIEMLSRNDIDWIDLLTELQEHIDALSLYPHRKTGHFNAEGYAFIGNRIVAEIARN